MKSRETTRAATYDEILALLEAQVCGLDEIQKEKEAGVEEYNQTEVTHRDVQDGKVTKDRSLTKRHVSDKIHEVPQWDLEARREQLDAFDKTHRDSSEIEGTVRLSNAVLSVFDEHRISQSGLSDKQISGRNSPREKMDSLSSKNRSTKSSPVEDTENEKVKTLLRHKVSYKRHTMEEVVLYDVDTFYEEQEKSGIHDVNIDDISFNTNEIKKKKKPLDVIEIEDDTKRPHSGGSLRRKRVPVTVKYIVTTDESKSHRRLSKKDWTKFLNQSVPSLYIEEAYRTSAAPLPTRELKKNSQSTNATLDISNIDPDISLVTKKVKSPKRKRRKPKTVTYIVTYGERDFNSLSSGRSEPEYPTNPIEMVEEYNRENINRNEQTPIVIEKQKRTPPEIKIQPADSLPDFYIDTTPQVITNRTFDVNQQPVAVEHHSGNFCLSFPTDTVKFVDLQDEQSDDNSWKTAESDFPVPEVKAYGKIKSKNKTDIQIVFDDSKIRPEFNDLEEKQPASPIVNIMELRLDPPVSFGPPLSTTNEPIEIQQPKGSQRRKKTQNVTYVVSYDEPFIDKPIGKYKRKRIIGSGHTKSGKKSTKSDSIQGSPGFSVSKRIPVVVTYLVNYDESPGGFTEQSRTPINVQGTYTTSECSPVELSQYAAPSSEQKVGRNVPRANVTRKSKRLPLTMTYVVNYDKPFCRTVSENDSYTGSKIKYWNLKRKNPEMSLPDTVAHRPEIRAQDMREVNILVDSPETRKIRLKTTPKFQDEDEYDASLEVLSNSNVPNVTEYRPTNSPVRALPYLDTSVNLHRGVPSSGMYQSVEVKSPERENINIFIAPSSESSPPKSRLVGERNQGHSTEVQINDEVNQGCVQEYKVVIPNLQKQNLKRKLPEVPKRESQIATYVVNADWPVKVTPWDIGKKKPPSTGKISDTTNSGVLFMSEIDRTVEVQQPIKYADAKSPSRAAFAVMSKQVSTPDTFVIMERTQEASMVIPESSSLEFPLEIPKPSPKSKHVPYTVTYKVGHEQPKRRKEWDIQMRKQPVTKSLNPKERSNINRISPNTGAVQDIEVSPKKIKKSRLPHVMTYRVTYDLPECKKEWDVKLKKSSGIPKSKPTNTIINVDYVSDGSHSAGHEMLPKSSSPRLPNITTYDISYEEPPKNQGWQFEKQASPIVSDIRTNFHTEVDIPQFTGIEKKPNSARMQKKLTYEIESDSSRRKNDWDFNLVSPQAPVLLQQDEQVRPSSSASQSENIDYTLEDPGVSYEGDFVQTKKMRERNVDIRNAGAPEIEEEIQVIAPVALSHPHEFHSIRASSDIPTLQTAVYNVYYGEPKVIREWDLKLKKRRPQTPRKAKSNASKNRDKSSIPDYGADSGSYQNKPTPETVTYQSTYGFSSPAGDTTTHEASYEIGIDNRQSTKPIASEVSNYIIEEPELSRTRAISSPVSEKQSHTVTYRITYEQPQGKKEWDIRSGKRRPNDKIKVKIDADIKPHQNEAAEEPRLGSISKRKEPVTVSYQVNYDKVEKKKEWDIKQKQKVRTRGPTNTPRIVENFEIVELGVPLPTPPIPRSPGKQPRIVTYQVNYDQPQMFREWDITIKKPRSSGLAKPCRDINVIAYPAKENIEPLYIESAHVPAVVPKQNSKTRVDKTVTYQTNNEQRRKFREWDIKLKKTSIMGKTKASTDIQVTAHPLAIEEPDAKRVVTVTRQSTGQLPQTATYQVNYDQLQKFKEWDIKVKKSLSSQILTVSADEAIVTYPVPKVWHAKVKKVPQIVTYQTSYDLPTKYKEYDIKMKKSNASGDRSQSNARVVARPQEFARVEVVIQEPNPTTSSESLKQMQDASVNPETSVSVVPVVSAGKCKSPITVTYILNYDRPEKWKEWDIKSPKSKGKYTINTQPPIEDLRKNITVKAPVIIPEKKELEIITINTDASIRLPERPEVSIYDDEPRIQEIIDEPSVAVSGPIQEVPDRTHEISYVIVHNQRGEDEEIEVNVPERLDWNIHNEVEISVPDLKVQKPRPYLETDLDDVITPIGTSHMEIPAFTRSVSTKVETPIVIEQKKPILIPSKPRLILVETTNLALPKIVTKDEYIPHSVTYVINYGSPEVHKEWDVKLKKPSYKVPPLISETESRPKKLGKSTVVYPQTVTYMVNYDETEAKGIPHLDTKKPSAKSQDQEAREEKIEIQNLNPIAPRDVNITPASTNETEPQTVTFIVEYKWPIEKMVKHAEKKDDEIIWTSKLPKPDETFQIEQIDADSATDRPKLQVLENLEIIQSENITPNSPRENLVIMPQIPSTSYVIETPHPDVAVISPVQPTPEGKTMTFIVKYEMPLAQFLKGRISKEKTKKSDNIDIESVPQLIQVSSDIQEERTNLTPSMTVKVPALKVSKVATKTSPDNQFETVTYVVKYKLPEFIEKNKNKTPNLKVDVAASKSPEESARATNTGDEEDVKRMLEGPETYFHIHQPSPEICLTAPELGKQAPGKKVPKHQQVTYTVSYDVVTKKESLKKSKSKAEKKFKAKVTEPDVPKAEVADVGATVNQVEQPAISVQISEEIPAVVETTTFKMDTFEDTNPEGMVYVVDENEMIQLEKREEPSDDLNIPTSSEQHITDFTITSVVVCPQDSDRDLDKSGMEINPVDEHMPIQPMIELPCISVVAQEDTEPETVTFEVVKPAIYDVNILISEPVIFSVEKPVVLVLPEYLPDVCESDVNNFKPIPVIKHQQLSAEPEGVTFVVNYDMKDLSLERKRAKTKLPEKVELNTVVTTVDIHDVKLPVSEDVKIINAVTEFESSQGAKVAVTTPDVAVEPVPVLPEISQENVETKLQPQPDTRQVERSVEVLKVLVPLMQTGAIYPSPLAVEIPKRVTYIVRHDGTPNPDRLSAAPTTDVSPEEILSKTDDNWRSCFGKQSQKPIKFEKRITSTAVKPTLAVSPCVRPNIDDQHCVLVPIVRDEVPTVSLNDFDSRSLPTSQFVVVAIDFGTTFSGYAFRFTRDSSKGIHIMRQWEGGDPGALDYKTPTTLLLTPDGKFHSFGFAARDFFHDLNPADAKRWMYFEKFKMTLHSNSVSGIQIGYCVCSI